MDSHTAGPWAYQALAGKHDFAVYHESTGRDLALVRDFHEGNARLIAAAPELLAALKDAVTILNGFPVPSPWAMKAQRLIYEIEVAQ